MRLRTTDEGAATSDDKESTDVSAPQSSDWDLESIILWAKTAKPNSRLAMWLLAHGREMSVTELNAVAVSAGLTDARGAIVGGINAAARLNSRLYALTVRDAGHKKVFAMRTELRAMFREALSIYPEVRELSNLQAELRPCLTTTVSFRQTCKRSSPGLGCRRRYLQCKAVV